MNIPKTMVIRPRDAERKPGISFEYIDKPGGVKHFIKGKRRHVMIAQNGTFVPGEPSDEIKLLPDKLFRALIWYETKRLLAWKSTLLEKINMGLMVVLVGILLFFLYLLVNS